RSGLRVSPLCLGALTFGEQWGLGTSKDDSKKVFDLYYEKGGNFIDTACIYNFGESERFLGDYVSDKRSELVIATKYSCTNLELSILKRLNMSYVDILYVHAYEYRTPIEEFMRSLDDVVRSGKVLYVAVSDIPSWALSRANTMAELRGWSPFIGLQTRYNLLDRSLEFDLQPACAELGIGILPWSIVADGLTPEQMKRLDDASQPTGREVPFPHSMTDSFDGFIGKNMQVPNKFAPIATTYNYGRLY
ncbi:Aldo/keto reductase, partial [Rhizophagus irregularis]